jgi:Ribbon-helix-helix domain
MKSLVVKRSVVVADHKTSVSVEDAFWNGLKEIARGRNRTVCGLFLLVVLGLDLLLLLWSCLLRRGRRLTHTGCPVRVPTSS